MERLSVAQFLERTASSEPVPGGGSVSALAGATAAALVEMVAGLSMGPKFSQDIVQKMESVAGAASELRLRLQESIRLDAEAYQGVMAAMKHPRETEEQKAARRELIQAALRQATLVPLDVARRGMEVMELCRVILDKGNRNAWTDAVVAVMMARTAVLGALCNVAINIESMGSGVFVTETNRELEHLRSGCLKLEGELIENRILSDHAPQF